MYYVVTTLSTVGFGDISATEDNVTEYITIMVFEFVGMLFYSLTIQNLKQFLFTKSLDHNNYHKYMVEVIENIIVKLDRFLPPS